MDPYADDPLEGTDDALSKSAALWENAGSEAPEVPEEPSFRIRQDDALPVSEAKVAMPPPERPKLPEPMVLPQRDKPPTSADPRPEGPPDWEKLQADLQAAEGRAGISRAVNQAFATVSPNQHFHADPNAGSEEIAQARAPIEMAKAKQGWERDQQLLDATKANTQAAQGKAAAAARAADPASPESQRARGAVKSFFKDVPLPPDFDTWSAVDVEHSKDLLKMLSKQQSEEKIAGGKAAEAEKAKATSVADRKKLMLQLYPESASEINGVTDLGAATALQTALEGRAGRTATQTHSDTEAAVAAARALRNQKDLKDYENSHRPMTAEQLGQLEGIEKSDAALSTFEKSMGDVSTTGGKIGAALPAKLSGAVGLPGSSFQSAKEGTAIALARGLEGGMARPGNVEIIMKMLPEASDDDAVKAQKLRTTREFIANNRSAFQKALEQSGGNPLKSTGGAVKMKFPDGSTYDVTADKVEKARMKGGVEVTGG